MAGEVIRKLLAVVEDGHALSPADVGYAVDVVKAEQPENADALRSAELAPLAYMRGRTLNDAFVVLDEAQNTTIAQIKMFLARLGELSEVDIVRHPLVQRIVRAYEARVVDIEQTTTASRPTPDAENGEPK